jgi:hypothetical protein
MGLKLCVSPTAIIRVSVTHNNNRKTMLQHLQIRQTAITARIADLKAQLQECNGELYRGCWLDSTTNSAGKSYTRLRWFTSLKPKRKGCKMLKGAELGQAIHALALWAELDKAESELAQVMAGIRKIEDIAWRYGLDMPD